MWLSSEKNIRPPDDTEALFALVTALRYAGYLFTSILPGSVASGNPSARGASPSAGLGWTFDAAGLGSSARVKTEPAPSKANGKSRARGRMFVDPQFRESGTSHVNDR